MTGVLDVGTAKICCLIWRRGGTAGRGRETADVPQLIGFGHQRSRGITAGLVTDQAEAERAVRAAVSQAERMASVLLDRTIVGIGAGRIASQRFVARATLDRGVVGRPDLDKIATAARGYAGRDGRTVVHLEAQRLSLDDHLIAGAALGLAGTTLKAEVHAVSVDTTAQQSLQALIEQCYLSPRFVPAALASALAVMRPEEREDGATVVDIGAGTTSLAAFSDGQYIATGQLPFGGSHVTYDLQRRLQTPLAEAERIKTLYGSLVAAPSNELERVSFPVDVDGEMQMASVSRAEIRSAIEPRMASILRMVADWRQSYGVDASGRGCVVVTGGGSQLVGLGAYAADRLGVPVRIGVPTAATGAQSNMRLAGYAVALGLLPAAELGAGDPVAEGASSAFGSRYLGRVGDWLRQSF